jgi:hypothetical protein
MECRAANAVPLEDDNTVWMWKFNCGTKLSSLAGWNLRSVGRPAIHAMHRCLELLGRGRKRVLATSAAIALHCSTGPACAWSPKLTWLGLKTRARIEHPIQPPQGKTPTHNRSLWNRGRCVSGWLLCCDGGVVAPKRFKVSGWVSRGVWDVGVAKSWQVGLCPQLSGAGNVTPGFFSRWEAPIRNPGRSFDRTIVALCHRDIVT